MLSVIVLVMAPMAPWHLFPNSIIWKKCLFHENEFFWWKKKFVNVGDEVWTNVGLMFNVFIVIVLCQLTESQNFEFKYSKFFNDCHNSVTCISGPKFCFSYYQKYILLFTPTVIFLKLRYVSLRCDKFNKFDQLL